MSSQRELLIQGLRQYQTVADLRDSPFFAEHGRQIHDLLLRPQLITCAGASPRLKAFLRVTQWNIEKGKRFPDIVRMLQNHEHLRWSDLVILNEADAGMNRSGNRHVARDLAETLGMNMVFGPAHLELTKGTDDDLALPGENSDSLQGNAVLSRHPIIDSCVLPLPVCFEPYEFHEKRYGWRNCTWARLAIGGKAVWVGSAHLEVRNTPGCRAKQMQHIVCHLPGSGKEAFLLGGDFNSNGFARGTSWRTLRSALKLVSASPDALTVRLRRPQCGSEPLFKAPTRAGFRWEGLNADLPTASAPLGELEDSNLLPEFLVRLIRRRLAPYEGYLHFRLDWLLGREVRPLRRDEILDLETGVSSQGAGQVSTFRTGPDRISDHDPIFADLSV